MDKKINLNVKTGLAKLMAIENITVIHSPKAKTASFDPKRRICVLPMLTDMTSFVYDWFIAHEVGHALFTPYTEEQWKSILQEIPHIFLNITEDARIEKLIKRKYPGTMKDCYHFYKKFSSPEYDFFQIYKPGTDISKFTLLNRINLHFKIGFFVDVPFSDEERKYVDMVANEETFEDAVEAAKAIYAYMKQAGQLKEKSYKDLPKNQSKSDEDEEDQEQGDSREEPMTVITDVPNGDESEDGDEEEDDSDDKEDDGEDSESGEEEGDETEEGEDESDSDGDEDGGTSSDSESDEGGEDEDGDDNCEQEGESSGTGDETGEDEESTSDGESEGDSDVREDEDDNNSSGKTADVETAGAKPGEEDEPEITDEAGDTQDNFDANFNEQFIDTSENVEAFGDLNRYDQNWKDYIDSLKIPNVVDLSKYNNFITSISPTVNMMVGYFNMKKSARDYEKTSYSKTGRLNIDQLSSYRTESDIFLRSEISHESKNHGMVMLIDWSISMQSNLKYTFKQLIVLIEFCKKVQIPFEVYGFTCAAHSQKNITLPHNITPQMGASVFSMLSSSMSSHDYKNTVAYIYNNIVEKDAVGNVHTMRYTPLISAAAVSEYIIRDFKYKFNMDKTVFVLLSDGEPTDSLEQDSHSLDSHSSRIIFRDSQTGRNYEHDGSKDGSPYHSIFKYIKEKYGVSKMVGFHLANKMDDHVIAAVSPNRYHNNNFSFVELSKTFREQKYVEFGKDVGFDKYYVVNLSNFDFDFNNKPDLVLKTLDTEKVRQKKIEDFLTRSTKPMIFMKKFIETIS